MALGLSVFKSKVSMRIILQFFLCAMLPIAIFAGLSFFQISSNLKEQSVARLQNNANSFGLILNERFSMLESELVLFGAPSPIPGSGIPAGLLERAISDHFVAVGLYSTNGTCQNLFGKLVNLPADDFKNSTAAVTSKTIIHFEPDDNTGSRVFFLKEMPGFNGVRRFLVGEVDTDYLWGISQKNMLPPRTDAGILDQDRNILYSSFSFPGNMLHQIRFESNGLPSKIVTYKTDGEAFFAAYWSLSLKSRFEGPNLIVVLRYRENDISTALSNFKLLFPYTALLSLFVVWFLSIKSIRKSLYPLEKLKEGARRLAQRDFDSRVILDGQDEFNDLAETFNETTASLGRQFRVMEAMADIDYATHTSLNTRSIVDTSLKRLCSFFSCNAVSLGLVNQTRPDALQTFSYVPSNGNKILEGFKTIASGDMQALSDPVDYLMLDVENNFLSYLPEPITQTAASFMVLPLYDRSTFSGILFLGHQNPPTYSEEDHSHAKRLSNQVALALSKVRLIEDLESLNWGALEALARTVDAKSRWTAGHSERVAEMSIRIARAMGCDDRTVGTIQRAAFLHDIGKIGIPISILDKPSALTEEEYQKVKEHPIIGAKIIEPIAAYGDTIPILLQHHECYDGKGYPNGLSGEDISLGARIISVADVYDALISVRPYRQGWVKKEVVRMLAEESGKKFDPNVISTFLSIVLQHENAAPGKA